MKDMRAYRNALEAGQFPVYRGYEMSPADLQRRTIIMAVMCDLKINFSELSEKMRVSMSHAFAKEIEQLAPLAKDGCIELSEDGFRVTDMGRFFIRNIAMVFDAGMVAGVGPQYSKTV